MSTAPSKKYCYFFVSIAGAKPRKIVFELFNDLVPLTCQNFLSFCESQDSNKTYKGTYFHRIIPGFMVQGGDYERNNGTGGETFDGGKLKDESFVVKHSEPGILSMANNGKPDSGKSQFFITTGKASHLDGKHVAFGRVIEGMSVVYDMESVETDEKDKPIFQKIKIVDCGIGEGTDYDNDNTDDSSELSDRKSKESSRKRKKRSRKREYSSEDSSSRKHRKRKSHKKKHRRRSISSSSSFGDDDSYVRERKKSSSKNEKRKKKKKKYHSSDESLSDDSHHRRRTKKSHKKDRHGKKNERSKQSSDANSSFGKYGIIRDSDLLNNHKVKRSFEIWLEEVKGVPLGANVSKYDVAKFFKDYVEDFNTATLPHEKYYDYDKWEMEEYARKKEESYAKSSVLGDEFEHREEMKRKAEEKKKKEFETVKMLMSKDKIEDMKRQALLKAELANAYRVGDEETRKKIQRRLEQDD